MVGETVDMGSFPCHAGEICTYKGEAIPGGGCPRIFCQKSGRKFNGKMEYGKHAHEKLERLNSEQIDKLGSSCENLKVRFEDMPDHCKSYALKQQSKLNLLIKKAFGDPIHIKENSTKDNYCHEHTTTKASYDICYSLPLDHDFGCGIPSQLGFYFENNNGRCEKVESAIFAGPKYKKLQRNREERVKDPQQLNHVESPVERDAPAN